MTNPEHLAILRKGTAAWNQWRVTNRHAQSPLSHIELSDWALEPDLAGAELRNADLCGADLTLTDLRGANIRRAELSEADLSLANLQGANLSEAHLDHAVYGRAPHRGGLLERGWGRSPRGRLRTSMPLLPVVAPGRWTARYPSPGPNSRGTPPLRPPAYLLPVGS
jgi:hypothetical protein